MSVPSSFPTYRILDIPAELSEADIRRAFSEQILGISVELSPFHNSTKVATITFRKIPECFKNLDPTSSRPFDIGPVTVEVDFNFWGLTTLHDPGDKAVIE